MAYYAARREGGEGVRVKARTLHQFAAPLRYESDLAVRIMQGLDDYYLGLRAEKLRRDFENK